MTDVSAFLGKPWRPVADGPDAYDCWGLTRAASYALFGASLPDLPDNWHPDVEAVPQHWRELDGPEPGAVVALGNYAGAIKHVCLSLGHGSVLNTGRESGAHVGSLAYLRRIYPVVRFYRWP